MSDHPDTIIVLDTIIFNLDDMLYAKPHEIVLKTNERIVATPTGSSSTYGETAKKAGLTSVSFTSSDFNYLKRMLLERNRYKDLYLAEKRKYDELKQHLLAMPDGPEYLVAKNHFENTLHVSNTE